MRLLLTRPMDQSEASAALLRGMGHEVIVTPVLEITPLPANWPDGQCDGLIATSARAFAALEARALPLFVVGEQTARAAQYWQGGEARVEMAADAAALAALLGHRPPARLLYLAGQDRKPHLEQALAEAGHRVQVLETYAARPALTLTPQALAALRSGAVEGVLHYSARSAAIFVRLADQAGLAAQANQSQHFCLSADVAVPLRLCGAGRVRVAGLPDENGLFGLLATR